VYCYSTGSTESLPRLSLSAGPSSSESICLMASCAASLMALSSGHVLQGTMQERHRGRRPESSGTGSKGVPGLSSMHTLH